MFVSGDVFGDRRCGTPRGLLSELCYKAEISFFLCDFFFCSFLHFISFSPPQSAFSAPTFLSLSLLALKAEVCPSGVCPSVPAPRGWAAAGHAWARPGPNVRRVPAGPWPLPGVSPSVPRGRSPARCVRRGRGSLPSPAGPQSPAGPCPRRQGRISSFVCAEFSLRAAARSGYGLALPALKGTTELIRLGSGAGFAVATQQRREKLCFALLFFSDSAGTLSMFVQKINLLELSGKKQ